jgi:hypothetical protein
MSSDPKLTYEPTVLSLSVYDLFLYLSNATLCIPDIYKDRVVQGMAYKLEEWANVSRPELRDALKKLDIKLEEMCVNCNEPMPDWNAEEQGEPVCSQCSKDKIDNLRQTNSSK